jgi:hypothetical protein
VGFGDVMCVLNLPKNTINKNIDITRSNDPNTIADSAEPKPAYFFALYILKPDFKS